MILKKLKSSRTENVNVSRFRIDWNHKVSKPQKAVKDFLYPYWKNDVVCEEFIIPGSLLRIDLVNIQNHTAIEVSPLATHSKYNKHFHGGNRFNFLASLKRDFDKEEWCKENGFKFVEIYDCDIEQLSPEWFKEKYGIIL